MTNSETTRKPEMRDLTEQQLDAVTGGADDVLQEFRTIKPYNWEAMYAWNSLCVQLFRQTF